VGITTAIHGAGGFGKTALAIELCYDEQVREQFPEGILWVQMRDTLDDDGRLKEIRDVLRRWTRAEPPAFETVAKAGQHLIELLNGRRVLLVVDDVWHSGDLSPFQGLSSAAALLVTTRDSRTLPRQTVAVHVDAMEIPEAVRLLGAGLPAGAEEELKALVARLGEWPLLLKLVNRQVASWIGKGLALHEAISRAENALKAKGLTYFDPKDAKDRSQAVALTLEAAWNGSPKKTRRDSPSWRSSPRMRMYLLPSSRNSGSSIHSTSRSSPRGYSTSLCSETLTSTLARSASTTSSAPIS